jgi:thiol-disulfide isomerase/thioredoxin
MIEIIDVKENKNIDKFNAAAKKAHDHPETHGLLVKIYADWCGHCRTMKADWKRLTRELKTHYQCKKPGCVLTIANIRAVNLEPNDPVIQRIKYIPKDIQGVPMIAYISKGARSLEYSNDRVYSEMLKWVITHPDFGLIRKADARHAHGREHEHGNRPLHGLTKNARTKFKHFHRATLKRFHHEMKRQHKKSVDSRMPTPVAHTRKTGRHIPAYLR